MRRGIAATTVVDLAADENDVRAALEAAYGDCPFVRLTGGRIPQTADVWGSNRCDIGWLVQGKHLMLFSAIDNLVKGASGQAVQCMNVRYGFPETEGLDRGGLL
jgi:N-acetyl-gamma-glutamyl-phosphate reductase